MSDILDRLRATCERARARGQAATHFVVDDIQQLIDENAQFEADCLDLIARQNEAAGLMSRPMTRAEAEAFIGE